MTEEEQKILDIRKAVFETGKTLNELIKVHASKLDLDEKSRWVFHMRVVNLLFLQHYTPAYRTVLDESIKAGDAL